MPICLARTVSCRMQQETALLPPKSARYAGPGPHLFFFFFFFYLLPSRQPSIPLSFGLLPLTSFFLVPNAYERRLPGTVRRCSSHIKFNNTAPYMALESVGLDLADTAIAAQNAPAGVPPTSPSILVAATAATAKQSATVGQQAYIGFRVDASQALALVQKQP